MGKQKNYLLLVLKGCAMGAADGSGCFRRYDRLHYGDL